MEAVVLYHMSLFFSKKLREPLCHWYHGKGQFCRLDELKKVPPTHFCPCQKMCRHDKLPKNTAAMYTRKMPPHIGVKIINASADQRLKF
jgi:hypothetical protein